MIQISNTYTRALIWFASSVPFVINSPLQAKTEQLKVITYNAFNLFDAVSEDNDKGDFQYLPLLKGGAYNTDKEQGCQDLYDTTNNPESYYGNKCLLTDWTDKKYEAKTKRISEALRIASGDAEGQNFSGDVIGFVEIENSKVIERVLEKAHMQNFKVLIADGSDQRGIRNALVINKTQPSLQHCEKQEDIVVPLPKGTRPTRNILHVSCPQKTGGLHFFVNHWPSQSKSHDNQERIDAMHALQKRHLEILASNPLDSFIAMGDFNTTKHDKPNAVDQMVKESNPAVSNVHHVFLNAGENPKDPRVSAEMAADMSKGTYYYFPKREWNEFDLFVTSKSMTEPSSKRIQWKVKLDSYMIHSAQPLTRQDATHGLVPNNGLLESMSRLDINRSKNKWGYSDHLPVSMIIYR